ncbi:hypothetical protein PYW08_003017 [Mythimna loreyi]|uniref:Uncharacterized protein n=1 Tax=Mythimna loreyi TaxID=667449 RepID=A0ACC2QQJ3_9NEOP|nr:hypothetical protein PYW08_003017 [Mythimna loreyi]
MNTIVTFSILALCTIQTIFCDDTLVKIQQGWLQGKSQEAICHDFDYLSFENIPYALPPTGERRFKAPEEPEGWEGTRDATAQGPMCPHYNALTDVTVLGSEDCLTCDVYTPDITKKLPVLIWFSGFAHFFDEDDNIVYKPDFLVKDMVVVRCNFRKDALGYLNLGTKDVPGNAALKDQVAAMKWVNNNIQAFGGDPERVTLAGISSGSASISNHIMSPMSSGLFHQVLMLSGIHSCDAIYPHAVKEKSWELGARLGLETDNPDELLINLQNTDYKQFINASYSMAMENKMNQMFKKMATFVPVEEEDFGQDRFITENPMESLYHAPLNKVKVMTGYSRDESILFIKQYYDFLLELYNKNRELFVPSKILMKSLPDEEVNDLANTIKNYYFQNKDIKPENMKEFIRMTSFSSMIYEVIRFARQVSQHVDTYLFEFDSFSDRNIYGKEGLNYGIEGTAHADMLGYLFPMNMPLDMESREHDLIVQFVETVKNFVINGDPAYNGNVSWLKFTPEQPNYLEFTDTRTLKENPMSEQMKFWDEIYERYTYPQEK